MLNYIVLAFSILVVPVHNEIHKQMTPQEVKTLFNTNHDEVPEYEVVSVAHTIHKRSPKNNPHRIVHIKSFKKDIKLYLEPAEGFLAGIKFPMWKVEGDINSPLGVKYTRLSNRQKRSVEFYQDTYNLAAITSSYDETGEVIFEGTIGNDFVVRPLPERFRHEQRRKRDVEDFPVSNRTIHHPDLQHTHQHIVFKCRDIAMVRGREKMGLYSFEEKSFRQKRSSNESNKEVPETIYPQILVFVDYTKYITYRSFEDMKRYVLSFWNGVDLRYRVFQKPQVRLNIVGIIVATEPNGAPFLQNYRSQPIDGPIVDADKALDHMAAYFFNETMDKSLQRFVLEKDFDIVMAMTRLDLCNLEPMDKDFDCATLGYAFRKGGCTVNIRSNHMESVAIVEDNGGYMGIIPAAHEVGHLMGAPHDGLEDDEEEICPKWGGYVMTGMLMLTENAFLWSTCSLGYFQKFFHSPRAECMFDVPKKVKSMRRLLPGRILSLDEQCDQIRGTHACNRDKTTCIGLKCHVRNSRNNCIAISPAAEGSDCGKNKYCLNGKCVSKSRTKEVILKFAPPPVKKDPFANYRRLVM